MEFGKQDAEDERKKRLDLVEKSSGDRKFLKDGSREYANKVLAERRCYQFVELETPKDGEEEIVKPIQINGAAIRTPAEDLVWAEEQKELEALAAKKKPDPKGKKK